MAEVAIGIRQITAIRRNGGERHIAAGGKLGHAVFLKCRLRHWPAPRVEGYDTRRRQHQHQRSRGNSSSAKWVRSAACSFANLLQRAMQFDCTLEAAFAFLLKAFVDDGNYLQREVGIDLAQRCRCTVENAIVNNRGGVAGKSALAAQHLIQHQAERENVGTRVQLLAPHLLGRHVERGAHVSTGECEPQDVSAGSMGPQALLRTPPTALVRPGRPQSLLPNRNPGSWLRWRR